MFYFSFQVSDSARKEILTEEAVQFDPVNNSFDELGQVFSRF